MRRLLLHVVGINDPQGSHAGVNVPSESDEMVALELAVNKSMYINESLLQSHLHFQSYVARSF